VAIEIKLLECGDEAVLDNVAPQVFDNPISSRLTAEFLSDPRHHLVVAIENGRVVGFASGVHYVHPDKPAELWVNELGITPTHRGRGLGKGVLQLLLMKGRQLGCARAWVLTDRQNTAATALYASLGGKEASVPSVMFEFALEPGSARS
jgi:aminoglycoside 6'-N-acetyltransferase I